MSAWPCLLLLFLCISQNTLGIKNQKDHMFQTTQGNDNKFSILIVSSPTSGHIIPLLNLGEELLRRGHNVTVCSLDSWEDNKKRVTDRGLAYLSAGELPYTKEEFRHLYKDSTESSKNLFTLDFVRAHEVLKKSIIVQIDGIMKYLVDVDLKQWDMIVVDEFMMYSISCLAKCFNYSVIGVSTKLLLHSSLMGPPWTFPIYTLGSGYNDNLTFTQRLEITLFTSVLYFTGPVLVKSIFYSSFLPDVCRNALYFAFAEGIEFPIIVTSVIGFEFPRTITPLTDYVGPILSKQYQNLTPDLQEWLKDQPKHSVIVISMGSQVYIDHNFAKALIQAIEKTNYKAIWSLRKGNEDVLTDIQYNSENFYISSWIPQAAVLQHTSIAIAIVHGGMGGINEALYNGVPIIVLPHGGDQLDNAVHVEHAGAGIMLDPHKRLTADMIKHSIETIESGEHRKKAELIRKLFLSAGGVNRAANLVELYTSAGYDHLIPAYVKYNWSWIEYTNIDVYCVMSVCLGIIIYLTIVVSRCCFKCCCNKSKKEKKE